MRMLIIARMATLTEMDAPSAFLFNLERMSLQQKQIFHLRRPSGSLTSDPAEMKMMTINFYADLYGDINPNPQCVQEILQGFPKLGPEQRAGLEGDL